MRNPKHPDREKVRIDFSCAVLNAASKQAQEQGTSLSAFIEELVIEKIGPIRGVSARGRCESKDMRLPSSSNAKASNTRQGIIPIDGISTAHNPDGNRDARMGDPMPETDRCRQG